MLRTNRAPDPVGSVVENNGSPVIGSRRNSENASGKEVASGPFEVAPKVKENWVPNVMFVKYSLKNDESVRVTVPGSNPLAPPVNVGLPSVPSVVKEETVIVFEGVPPSIKSNAS
jgi:hypothetical protein